MAFLPLTAAAACGQAGLMGYFIRRAAAAGTRSIRAVASVLAEMHAAGRRAGELMMAPDCYLSDPDTAPDTYQEFLFRTSGSLIHEASARGRKR
jgi:hypothetical protein